MAHKNNQRSKNQGSGQKSGSLSKRSDQSFAKAQPKGEGTNDRSASKEAGSVE
jgi:hypothetical protein